MKNYFKHQYFSIMGDSISTYEGYLPEGHPSFYNMHNSYTTNVYGPRETWWRQVLDHFEGMLLVNNSWSGSYVCMVSEAAEPSAGCGDTRTSHLGNDGISPDQILIYIATNDRGAGFPLTSEDKTDLRVIENAYGVMLDKIKKNYPNAEIWCCTFPITSCSRDPYFYFPKTNRGIPMEAYGELIHKVAEERGCHVVELWDKECCDTIDGLHPNFNGMKMIASKVIAAMEAYAEGKQS